MNKIETPILFLIFNRPKQTKEVLHKLSKFKPSILYIAADGPRPHKLDDEALCNETRRIVEECIDWPCEKHYLFREKNLGCGIAVSQAITWFFENVDAGIIIEDDIIVEEDFFIFCEKMLEEYKDEPSVMHISGSSHSGNKELNSNESSFYFSEFPFIWGWATWANRWAQYEYNILNQLTDEDVSNYLNQTSFSQEMKQLWVSRFKSFKQEDESFTWDYQWFMTIWKNRGLAILPKMNLVRNIGWGEDATHTVEASHHLGNMKIEKLTYPLISPSKIEVDMDNLEKDFKNYFTINNKELDNAPFTIFNLRKIRRIIKSIISKKIKFKNES